MDNLIGIKSELLVKTRQVAVYANGLALLQQFIESTTQTNESGKSVISTDAVLQQLEAIKHDAFKSMNLNGEFHE